MRDWAFGINSHPDWRKGHVEVIEQPWWLCLAEWAAPAVAWRWLSYIKLPNWPRRRWQYCEPDELYTPREYWGDVGQLVWAYVNAPDHLLGVRAPAAQDHSH